LKPPLLLRRRQSLDYLCKSPWIFSRKFLPKICGSVRLPSPNPWQLPLLKKNLPAL
jgi:hypothetical protein